MASRHSRRRVARGAGRLLGLVLAVAVSLAPPSAVGTGETARMVPGINLAGAEFGAEGAGGGARGRHGSDYVYPVAPMAEGYAGPAYFRARGFRLVRLPFLWERIQPRLGGPLDGEEAQRLKAAVDTLVAHGFLVVADLHNYGRYEGRLLGADGPTNAEFADVWRRLAVLLGGADRIMLGLMNEPDDLPTEAWVDAANAAIRAIRAAGSPALVLVGGNGRSSAELWSSSVYGTPNAAAMLAVRDPLQRVAFEAHLYLDADGSGTSADCASAAIGVERLQPFVAWLAQHGKQGFLGEVGGGPGPLCAAAIRELMSELCRASRHLIGWAWWAGGPWWRPDYPMWLDPTAAGDAPQIKTLAPWLGREPCQRPATTDRPTAVR